MHNIYWTQKYNLIKKVYYFLFIMFYFFNYFYLIIYLTFFTELYLGSLSDDVGKEITQNLLVGLNPPPPIPSILNTYVTT